MSSTALAQVATRLSITETELQSIVMKTVMPSNKQITNEQFVSFIAVANEYKLNPLVKEIYAFPTQQGGIQPIVSIDGWLRIINSNPDFNGMVFKDNLDANNALISITCSIHKKGIEHPVQVTEYMAECKMNTQPWQKYPARMLRHKAAIQCGRYAFGLSGIIDPDEAERYQEGGVIDMGKAERVENDVSKDYPQDRFDANFPEWKSKVETGAKSKKDLVAFIKGKGNITSAQLDAIDKIEVIQN